MNELALIVVPPLAFIAVAGGTLALIGWIFPSARRESRNG